MTQKSIVIFVYENINANRSSTSIKRFRIQMNAKWLPDDRENARSDDFYDIEMVAVGNRIQHVNCGFVRCGTFSWSPNGKPFFISLDVPSLLSWRQQTFSILFRMIDYTLFFASVPW